MRKYLVIVVAMVIISSVAYAQRLGGTQGSADVDGIKEATIQTPSAQKTYEIPMYDTLPLRDGSGNAEVYVGTIKVTKTQLQQLITTSTSQVENLQKRIFDAQAQLVKIEELEGK